MPNVEQLLERLRKKVPVNEELKTQLRSELVPKRRQSTVRRNWLFLGAVAAVLSIVIGSLSALLGPSQPVAQAAELEVAAQYSFIDLTSGQHGAPAVYGDKIYLPLLGKGIYLFDSTAVRSGDGLTLILDEPNVNAISISYSGRKLLYSVAEGIYIYDLEANETRALIESNSSNVYYDEPSWCPDDSSVLVTRKTVEWLEHGFQVKAEEIIQVSVVDGKETKITDGKSASIAPNNDYMVFARDGSIYVRALRSESVIPWRGLKAGQEKNLGPGYAPSISPDGQFVAYLRLDDATRKLTEQASIHESVSNVYIASVRNFSDQRQITANYPYQWLNEAEWAQGVKGKETLELPGYHTYFSAVWGGSNDHLYVLKSDQRTPFMRLMRVDLETALSEGLLDSGAAAAMMKALASQYLEALVNRDADTAYRLYKGEEAPDPVSNPHPIGFSIIGNGAQEGREYVDAVQLIAYDGELYYQVLSLRFYMQRLTGGFAIAEIAQTTQSELYAKNDVVYLNGITLFSATDIGGGALGPAAYDQSSERVFFTLYTDGKAEIKYFDLATRQSGHVYTFSGENTRVTNLSLNAYNSGEEGFLSINYMSSGHEQRALLYSLKWSQPVQTLGRANSVAWAGGKLVCYTENAGEMVRWEYDPLTGTSRIWPE